MVATQGQGMNRWERVRERAIARAARVVAKVLEEMQAEPLPQDQMRALFAGVMTEQDMMAFIGQYGQEAWDKQGHLAYLDAARKQSEGGG